MTQKIRLIGGPKNDDVIELPTRINFKAVDMREGYGADEVIYTICKSGDGVFYGVFNPSSDEPSIARIEALRNTILGNW